MSVTLTPKLKKEYQDLFDSCEIKARRKGDVKAICDKIVNNKGRYQTVEDATKVPWYVVGTIHSLEGSLNFNRHLHNGDPLTARTVHVPKGRPPGTPPFKWEDSAIDALQFDGLSNTPKWNLPVIMFKLEGFNGFGYRTRHPEVLTPYLWSFTNHYSKGKFVADGKFDPATISKQCGAAAILKTLVARGDIQIPA
jgi:lysozyme family protein